MIIFTPNTVIKSTEINANFAELITPSRLSPETVSAHLAASFTSTTTTSFQDTGLSVTLANAGTWVLIADLRATVAAQQRFFTSRFFNSTTSTAYANSERLGNYIDGVAGVTSFQSYTVMTEIITTTSANNVIRVEIRPGAAYTVSISSDTNGKSAIRGFRIG